MKATVDSYRPLNTILLLKTTCVFWIIAKLIGWRMFTAYRLFPTAPVFAWLDFIPTIIHALLFVLSIFIMLWIIAISDIHKMLLIALLAIEIFACILDQNRWQPWEYQYLFTVFIFVINSRRPNTITTVLSFIISFIYIYSGLSKFSLSFVQSTWADTILGGFLRLSPQNIGTGLLFYAGYSFAFVEMLLGIGLLFAKTRRNAATLLIGMHCFILVLFGPFGLNFNIIIWPWNIAMVVYLFLLFIKPNPHEISFPLLFNGANKLSVLAWGILPVFSQFGYWDYYLSSSLYSDRPPKMKIVFKDNRSCNRIYHLCDNSKTPKEVQNNVLLWSYAETNVPVYPELRVYKILQHKLEIQYPDAGLQFIYHSQGKLIK